MCMIYNIYIIIPSVHQGVMSNHKGNTLKLWCREDMVREVALVNEDMTTSEAALYPAHLQSTTEFIKVNPTNLQYIMYIHYVI